MSSLHKISVIVLIFFFSLTATAGDPYRPSAGAGEAGMGFTCVMKSSFWSSFHNQASLASNRSYLLGFNYENRFSLEELGTRTAAIIIPAWKTSLGAVYSYFGYHDFRREMVGLASGIKLSEQVSAGVQIDYFSDRSAGEYENYQAVTFETGILLFPSDNIRIGVHLFNPLPNSIREKNIPARLRIGAGTDLSTSLFAAVEAEMSTGSNLILRTGFEYETANKLWIRGGFSTENNSFSFGLGYLTKVVRIDLGFATHEKLGVTSSVSLIFKIH